MARIEQIDITGFKNYARATFLFNHPVTGIAGLNGKGKTNLLDAVYSCCLARSYFTASDAACIRFGEPGYRLEARFTEDNRIDTLLHIFRLPPKKELMLNGVPYDKISEHIGRFPAVMIAPDDIELVNGPPETRRKFFDLLLCQLQPDYLQALIQYNKIIQHRNSLLRNPDRYQSNLQTVLDGLDEQILAPAHILYRQRKQLAQDLNALIAPNYTGIAGPGENVLLQYQSQLHQQSFQELLQQLREKELLMQRSLCGLHKDDWLFTLNEIPFRGMASQGQRKSLLFAIKLAERDLIFSAKKRPPILLLDDVFEKLDAERMHNLLQTVCGSQSQVLISDTHADRMQHAFKNLQADFSIIQL